MFTAQNIYCTIHLNFFCSNHVSELKLHQYGELVSYLRSIVLKKIVDFEYEFLFQDIKVKDASATPLSKGENRSSLSLDAN